MSKLEELIQELCPNGVKYDSLVNVCNITKGVQLNKDKLKDDGLYPVINGGINPSGYWDEYNFEAGLITISQGGASAGYVNFIETPFWAGAHCYVVKSAKEYMDYKFVYYLFKHNEKKFMECQYGAGIPSLSMKTINDTKVPVPPIEVQSEIVRILDNFTLLTAELTAELTARKEQYEYYRNELFNKSIGKKTTLGDICKFVRGPFGGSLKKEIFVKSGYAVYEQQNAIYNNLNFRYYVDEIKFNSMKRFEVYPGDLIMSCSGTIGRIMVIPTNSPRGIINQALLKLTPIDGVNSYYLKYVFDNYITAVMNATSRGGALKNVPSVDVLKKIEIFLPSFEEQQRIVELLDKFESYCSDMTQGLPAEIELRKQQYEYYRDKLLTFKELE